MSLILWSLSKEMRLLMQLFEQPQNALQLGIWKNQSQGYINKPCVVLSPQTFLAWPGSIAYELMPQLKDLGHENPEHLVTTGDFQALWQAPISLSLCQNYRKTKIIIIPISLKKYTIYPYFAFIIVHNSLILNRY